MTVASKLAGVQLSPFAPTSKRPRGGNPNLDLPTPTPGTDDNKIIVVDPTGTFYEIVAPVNSLPSPAGNGLKTLQVNSGGTGYQLVAVVALPTLPSGTADIGLALGVITDGAGGQKYALVQPGQPTGWSNIGSFGPGMSSQDGSFGYPAAARIINGDTVELCGAIGGAAGVIVAQGAGPSLLATLATAFRPAEQVELSVTCSFPSAATALDERLIITPNGQMNVGAVIAHQWASLDGLRYRLT